MSDEQNRKKSNLHIIIPIVIIVLLLLVGIIIFLIYMYPLDSIIMDTLFNTNYIGRLDNTWWGKHDNRLKWRELTMPEIRATNFLFEYASNRGNYPPRGAFSRSEWMPKRITRR